MPTLCNTRKAARSVGNGSGCIALDRGSGSIFPELPTSLGIRNNDLSRAPFTMRMQNQDTYGALLTMVSDWGITFADTPPGKVGVHANVRVHDHIDDAISTGSAS